MNRYYLICARVLRMREMLSQLRFIVGSCTFGPLSNAFLSYHFDWFVIERRCLFSEQFFVCALCSSTDGLLMCQQYGHTRAVHADELRVGPHPDPHVQCVCAKDLLPPFFSEIVSLDLQRPTTMFMMENLILKFVLWLFMDSSLSHPRLSQLKSR